MSFPTFSIHGGGGDPSGGLLALLDQFLAKISGGAEGGDGFQFFPGIAVLGENVHPMIVHFPIALLTSFYLIEICGLVSRSVTLRVVARWLLSLGALGALAAVAAGLVAAERVPHGAAVHEILEWHERLGITVASLSVILAIWRWLTKESLSTMGQTFQLILSTIVVVCLSVGADLGGLMVYGHGVGVRGVEQVDHQHHGKPNGTVESAQ